MFLLGRRTHLALPVINSHITSMSARVADRVAGGVQGNKIALFEPSSKGMRG